MSLRRTLLRSPTVRCPRWRARPGRRGNGFCPRHARRGGARPLRRGQARDVPQPVASRDQASCHCAPRRHDRLPDAGCLRQPVQPAFDRGHCRGRQPEPRPPAHRAGFVKGQRPDVLAVTIEKIEPGPDRFGYTVIVPVFEFPPRRVFEPFLRALGPPPRVEIAGGRVEGYAGCARPDERIHRHDRCRAGSQRNGNRVSAGGATPLGRRVRPPPGAAGRSPGRPLWPGGN